MNVSRVLLSKQLNVIIDNKKIATWENLDESRYYNISR